MQTFLPYPDIIKSLGVLDNKRLGKQRVEARQILDVLDGKSQGWKNHPAVLMWKGYEPMLEMYFHTACLVWQGKGFKNEKYVIDWARVLCPVATPPWFGDPAFHQSHQSNLVRKNPEHYRPFFPDVPDNLPYVWPVRKS